MERVRTRAKKRTKTRKKYITSARVRVCVIKTNASRSRDSIIHVNSLSLLSRERTHRELNPLRFF